MKILLIAAVLGCALVPSAIGNVVADAGESSLQLSEAPQNVVNQSVAIVAEPLNEAISPQVQKILSTIPELIQGAVDGQLNSAEVVGSEKSSAELSALPQDVAVQNNRDARQLIGLIPTYMLRPAIRFVQREVDDDFFDDDVEEERAIRRRKRVRRRNIRVPLNKPRRRKNSNKRNQVRRKKANNKRKPQKRGSALQKKKMPRKNNKNMRRKNKPNRFN